MVVPAGPSRDRHEAATWPLRWPWYFFMGPRQTRVEEEVSKALREDRAEHWVERTATSRCDFDTFGVMKIIRHSLSAR